MEVRKGMEVTGGGVATAVQMEAINTLARAKMTAEQVMTMMNISDEDRTIMMKKIH